MSFTDRALTCVDCNGEFTFAADEQELFANKGYTNDPKRCPECRSARRQQNGDSGGSFGGGYQRQQREMFPAVCATCNKDTQVPFQPRNGRPVYCSACYAKTSPPKRY